MTPDNPLDYQFRDVSEDDSVMETVESIKRTQNLKGKTKN
jgi:hypothetical protein